MAKSKVAAPAVATNVLYVVTEKGLVIAGKQNATVQRPEAEKPFGFGWRAAGFQASNTRAVTLSALADLGEFGELTAHATLKACGREVLRSGTPRSYFNAFVKAGYIAEVVA